MKKELLIFTLLLRALFGLAQNPDCDKFYSDVSGGNGIYAMNTGVPNSATLLSVPVPTGAAGLAVGPSLGFNAPNPTFWVAKNGTYWYYDGTSFVNTNHQTGSGAFNFGSGKNVLYSLDNNINAYNGTGNAVPVCPIPTVASGCFADIVGDANDNFYLLSFATAGLYQFNSLGTLTNTFALNGIQSNQSGGAGFAIRGNTIVAYHFSGFYIGTISGSVVNFTLSNATFPNPSDMASCDYASDFASGITASPHGTLSCANPFIVLTATAGVSPVTYTWSGPGIVSPVNQQTVQANAAGEYSCYLTSSSGGTSMATYSVVYINAQLTPSIFSSGGSLCTNSNIQLTAAPSSTDYIYQWAGPAIIGATNGTAVSITAGGIYTLSVIEQSTGCSGTETVNVQDAGAPLVFSITPSFTNACFPGPEVKMLISTSANYSWLPVGTTSPATGPLVSTNPSVTTTYTVVATLGACKGFAMVTVSVTTSPSLTVNATQSVICEGSSTMLNASGAENYVWFPGQFKGTEQEVSPLANIVYTVTGNNSHCIATETILVEVLPSPHLEPVATNPVICIGETVTLTAFDAGTYTWTPGTMSGSTLTVSPTVTSMYTVSGTNAEGCASVSQTIVYVKPSYTVTLENPISYLCLGESVTLSASGAPGFTWHPGPITGNSLIVTPTVNSTYYVFPEAVECGVAGVAHVQVIDCSLPVFGITHAAEVEKVDSKSFKVHFTVTATNNSPVTLTDVVLTTNLRETFPEPCRFEVSASPTNATKQNNLKTASGFDGQTKTELTTLLSTLSPFTTDTIVYSVLVEPGNLSGRVKSLAIGTSMILNKVELRDTSNTGFNYDPDNDGNPTNNNEPTYIEIPFTEIFIPEGFTPNDDGLYDYFVITGLNGRSAKLSVFNRWGNFVYEKQDYDNTWDGRANTKDFRFGNGKLPQATYYYILQLNDGKKETFKGFVVLDY